MILLKAAPHGCDPAGRINGRAVRTPHLFEQNNLRALFGRFECRTHAGEAGANYDDIPIFTRTLLFRAGNRSSGNPGRRRGAKAEDACFQDVSTLHRSSFLLGSLRAERLL